MLDNNKIVELSDDVAKLKQLTTLSLRGNYLERLHPAVCRLPKLRKLDLGHNHLTVLPSEIRGLVIITHSCPLDCPLRLSALTGHR